jgi:hypothetical protein
MAMDYFGGGWLRYELGEKYVPRRSPCGPYQGWQAVSATLLKLPQGQWDSTVKYPPANAYEWLQGRVLVATIGYSIFVFDLRDMRVRGSPALDDRQY